ncbi:MAG: hypothetical protein HKN57_01450 [Xanthomonadales bacterium]|nr:hypothetical protein [Gammaproteobacteria bacterium]NND55895.1 hypothetical protein [Xanthomonadales bacterium]NNK50593.1 hypothetical protein [Xanthomonadales bacterium]
MKRIQSILVLGLFVSLCGCAGEQAMNSGDEAMALYRECMRDTPQHWGATDYSDSLSGYDSSVINGPVATLARDDLEYRDQVSCMQQAGIGSN